MNSASFNNLLALKGLLLKSTVELREEILKNKDSNSPQIFKEWIGIKEQLAKSILKWQELKV
ncbi:hypothetical protein GCM10010465_10390 [Actinomadura fibrosa]